MRKGRRTPSGLLLIDKPEGLTSAAVVAKIKRRFGLHKVGHAGTLDPLATGVLPICINEGTKLAGYLSERGKGYRVGMRLGIETDTYDNTGEILSEQQVVVAEEEFYETLKGFLGEQMQVPPVFSAKKKDGQALYKLARRGEDVEVKPARVVLHEVALGSFRSPQATFEIHTSKGYYVRSLCHDVGKQLGCGAHMESLVRTAHGVFSLDECVSLPVILDADDGELHEHLIPLESERIDLPILKIDARMEREIEYGRPLTVRMLLDSNISESIENITSVYRAIGPEGQLRALVTVVEKPALWGELEPSAVAIKVERGFQSLE